LARTGDSRRAVAVLRPSAVPRVARRTGRRPLTTLRPYRPTAPCRPEREPMPADQVDDARPHTPPTGARRRAVLRSLLGGGALTPLAATPATPTSAAPHPARPPAADGQGADPFAADTFHPSGRVREYWIQAESFPHTAAPNGYDAMSG